MRCADVHETALGLLAVGQFAVPNEKRNLTETNIFYGELSCCEKSAHDMKRCPFFSIRNFLWFYEHLYICGIAYF